MDAPGQKRLWCQKHMDAVNALGRDEMAATDGCMTAWRSSVWGHGIAATDGLLFDHSPICCYLGDSILNRILEALPAVKAKRSKLDKGVPRVHRRK